MKTPIERLRELRGKDIHPPRPMTPQEAKTHNKAAREEIDPFFSGPIMAALARLHREGRLPSLADDPGWQEVEREWEKASEGSSEPCDAGRVKALMSGFVEARGGTVEAVPKEPAPEVRAVRIRHTRTRQEVVVLSTVLKSWLRDGWEEILPGRGLPTGRPEEPRNGDE
jgi:hypothetical protein